jgi:hypothetical protein
MLNSKFPKLRQWLGKYGYLLAAFLVPLFVRSIPEVLSWPYPLGLDTLNVIPPIQSGWAFFSGPVGFLHITSMFYLFAILLYGLTHNVVFVLKFFGPVLLAVLCGMMFLYARKGLDWSNRKSLLVSILVATYFVALRDSWDLYRQTLGLIFLMAVLISLKSFSSPRKYYIAGAFMVLTVLSHELASVILFFVILIEAAQFLIKKSTKNAIYLIGSAAAAGALFLFQRVTLTTGAYSIPSSSVASGPSVALALLMAGLLVYCYVIILPLVFVGLVGFKVSAMHYWALLCLGIVLLEMVNPNLPLYFWNRWVILLVYPLLFFAAQGFDNIWKFWSSHKGKIRRLVPKVFAITYLVLLLTLSGFYLAASPENQIFFFSKDNPYLTFIPSSMLQNTLPIADNPALVKCFEWVNNNTAEDSAVVMHYALYDLAVIYVNNRLVIPVYQGSSMLAYIQNETTLVDGMVAAARVALNNGHGAAYTVWWVSGKGWYGIPSLPAEFREVFQSGNMAVYLYDPSV